MLEVILFIGFILMGVIPCGYYLGIFIANTFNEEIFPTNIKSKACLFFESIESPIYKLCGINKFQEMTAKEYFFTIFYTNISLCIFSFLVLYFQTNLPFKGNIDFQLDIPIILHMLSSQITNTCQTHHIPEQHLTPLSNYFIMPLLMFYSSGSGIATGIVFMRALIYGRIGNSYVDIIKAMVRILFPLSIISSIIFVSCGTPNTFTTSISYETIEKVKETLLLGPVASFEAIKLIGENGLSCFNANSAHPFESPSYLSNFFQVFCILLIPTALLIVLGIYLKNIKQSITIISVLYIVLIFEILLISYFELKGNTEINNIIGMNAPNWIGKETRFGIAGSSIFTALVSNVSGSANSSFDAFNPVAIALALFNLSNQSFFGVQGFGLVFTINFIIYTAYLIGLMLGRTPEVFGKRIEKKEIILSSILILINPILVLSSVAFTLIMLPEHGGNTFDHIHYYTRVFYEFASGAASNGSGLEGLDDNNTYWNLSLAFVMFVARYAAMSSMIFLGASFINKPTMPSGIVTLRTDNVLFGTVFLFFSIISTVLTYFPFIILGPISEILSKAN